MCFIMMFALNVYNLCSKLILLIIFNFWYVIMHRSFSAAWLYFLLFSNFCADKLPNISQQISTFQKVIKNFSDHLMFLFLVIIVYKIL